jgi:hypothetical protein
MGKRRDSAFLLDERSDLGGILVRAASGPVRDGYEGWLLFGKTFDGRHDRLERSILLRRKNLERKRIFP